MPPRILVAYATKHETTREIADAIAVTLREDGLVVEAVPAGTVTSVAGYDAVVIGSPIYMGKILKEAKQFVDRFAAFLQEKPVAAFAVGMSCKDLTDENCKKVEAAMEPITARVPIRGEMGIFAGRMNPSYIPVLGLFMRYDEAKTEDARDWGAIRAWTGRLPARLGLAAPPLPA
ncbi:flavodoxin domain-containing protein [Methanofollis ethanolicus]|uniref:flavodoxin domain-containing protein n=1 Tax=Methanofollis ethanolicus TaxID=488124 RepID=UPI00083772E7|nr:flavodoxin domain-containing protein [Methanofollis ethanolicus]